MWAWGKEARQLKFITSDEDEFELKFLKNSTEERVFYSFITDDGEQVFGRGQVILIGSKQKKVPKPYLKVLTSSRIVLAILEIRFE
jgi:hypothetical protein